MAETFTLPAPISVNRMYSGKVRASDAYRAWKAEASAMLRHEQRAHKRTVSPPYEITVAVPNGWGGDADNCLKAALDALQAADAITNDKHNRRMIVEWHDGPFTVTVQTREVATC